MEMDAEDFSRARTELDLTQEEMARRLGVCTRTCQHYEAGTHRIPSPVAQLVRLWLDRPEIVSSPRSELPGEELTA